MRLPPSTDVSTALRIDRRSLWRPRRNRPHLVPPGALLPARAVAIWRERTDLQRAFDLAVPKGRRGMFWWYLLHGFREYGLAFDRAGDAPTATANQPVPGLPCHGFTPISWLMREFWQREPDRRDPIGTPAGQKAAIARWFAQRLVASNLGSFLTKEQAAGLLTPNPGHGGAPHIFVLIWQHDAALRHRFVSPADPKFQAACRAARNPGYPILEHPLVALNAPRRVPIRAAAAAGGHDGINLFGHAHSRSGLGEDLRMAAATLLSGGNRFIIRNVPTAADGDLDPDLAPYIAEGLPFATNLYCITGMSTVPAIMADRTGRAYGDGRRNIGFWPWELPEWPPLWRHAFDLVDEVWASSRYTADAYLRSAPIPVRHVPMAVAVADTEGLGRADFGLANDRFLFAFAFDVLSTASRKNPAAVLAAFYAAFDRSDDSVGLVVKGLRSAGDPAWADLARAAVIDPRICLVEDTLSRGALLDLYRSVDCFVSLHRAEGFGRNLAEFMLLGRPVIATAHSGNTDFTDHETAALIPARLRRLAPGDYPYGAGQTWAEPDAAAAAAAMRRMVADRKWRQALARAGQARIAACFSPQAVCRRWAAALDLSVRG